MVARRALPTISVGEWVVFLLTIFFDLTVGKTLSKNTWYWQVIKQYNKVEQTLCDEVHSINSRSILSDENILSYPLQQWVSVFETFLLFLILIFRSRESITMGLLFVTSRRVMATNIHWQRGIDFTRKPEGRMQGKFPIVEDDTGKPVAYLLKRNFRPFIRWLSFSEFLHCVYHSSLDGRWLIFVWPSCQQSILKSTTITFALEMSVGWCLFMFAHVYPIFQNVIRFSQTVFELRSLIKSFLVTVEKAECIHCFWNSCISAVYPLPDWKMCGNTTFFKYFSFIPRGLCFTRNLHYRHRDHILN